MPHTIFTILMAEDNLDDVLLAKRCLKKIGVPNPVQVARDGQDAIDYLSGVGKYQDRTLYPLPRLIILDIKMPKITGLEVLEWLRSDPNTQFIPAIIYTSSQQISDVCQAYRLGACGYFVKPHRLEDNERIFQTVHQYWKSSILPDIERCKLFPKENSP